MKTLLILAASLLIAAPANAFTARITSCHDGDRCRYEAGQGTLKVRLAEIDLPEIDQSYGLKARDTLCAIVCGRDVDIERRGTSYDRLVGLIRVRGLDTGEAMVRAGAAWDYQRYDPDPTIPALEARARAGRIGLWASSHPVAPWDWRRGVGRFTPPQ